MTLPQIPKFEKKNNISVNLFGFEDEIFPLYITNNRCEKHVNLLYFSDGEKSHYCWIKNMSRLLSDRTKHNGQSFYCDYCLHRFAEEKTLLEHIPYCKDHGVQKIKMPSEEEKWMEFTNFSFQLKVPFVIYADFESVLAKMSSCSANPDNSSTEKIALHVPCGYAYVVIDRNGRCHKPPVVYRGEDAVPHFLQAMLREEEELSKIIDHVYPIHMTAEDEENFQKSTTCHICKEPLGSERARDHLHLQKSHNYNGSAHLSCNLNYKISKKIIIFFHNLMNYDLHLIMQEIGKIKDKRINCISRNFEKYITVSLGRLQFLDSFQFMNSSLEKLASNLSPAHFNITTEVMGGEKLHLLLRKGVYPYEFMDTFTKFNNRELPAKEAFYNSLKDEEISDADYNHAQEVWKAFNMETMGDYHNLYLITDVLILADTFEEFRKMCLCNYEIDPCHTFTAPGLSWQACLKMTKVRIELLTDPTMYMFLEKAIRGGVAQISKRYEKANNTYMKNYNPEEEDKFILYLDANNLYGYAMSQYLPLKDFTWTEPSKFNEKIILSLKDDSNIGYVFEVDLHYPTELHDQHNEYPLAPERMEITSEMVSEYTIISDRKMKSLKLTPNLNDKEKYIVHYKNLKLYLQLGLQIKKIHKVLQFKQEAWLKPYIDFNTEQRKKSKNEFEKKNFKLMNNSIFGKSIENLRSRVDIELTTTEKRAKKIIASPSYKTHKIFNEHLTAVEKRKTSLTLNRPIYAGFSILDISKVLMYEFHYLYIKEKYGERAQLLFTDTDSLTYTINTKDVYRDMSKDLGYFDTSNYPKKHFLYSEENKKKIGKMKDEMNGEIITEFCGLRAKMYSIITEHTEKKVAKGVLKSVLKKKIKHENFKECLFQRKITKEEMKNIRSEKHQLHTIKTNKISLSPFDDKRYILKDGVNTLAHGHYKICKK